MSWHVIFCRRQFVQKHTSRQGLRGISGFRKEVAGCSYKQDVTLWTTDARTGGLLGWKSNRHCDCRVALVLIVMILIMIRTFCVLWCTARFKSELGHVVPFDHAAFIFRIPQTIPGVVKKKCMSRGYITQLAMQ
jgi:hypothetical protein